MKKNRLVVGDGLWAESIPVWLKEEIKSERLIGSMASLVDPFTNHVGDAEVIAFLMTASLRAPLSRGHAEIYLYLGAKMLERKGQQLDSYMMDKLDKGLTEDEARELKDLKEMIFHKRGGDLESPLLTAMKELKKKKGGELCTHQR